jgi:plasmid stabilization system protein ParE
MSRIRITPLAEQDLVEIWYFIAQDDPGAADLHGARDLRTLF